jgi:hypothetical protein
VLGAGGRPMAANPLSALVTRRSGRLSWWLRGAAEAGATSYRRGSSSRGTPGHYASGPVAARKLPRRRVVPHASSLRVGSASSGMPPSY